jgi:hypothetical protein
MNALDPRSPTARDERRAVTRVAVAVWDFVFGAPRARDLPDGGVTVRLMGRRFEASSRDVLFDTVVRERERLLITLGKVHEGAATRPLLGGARMADTYHRESQRLQDRIAVYSDFIGRLGRELGLDQN